MTTFRIYWNAAPAGVPGTISDLAAAPASVSSLGLTFTNASGATSHQKRYALAGSGNWTNALPIASSTVVGLKSNAAYDVQVRGVNVSGNGAWSNTGTGTTSAATENVTGVVTYSPTGDAYVDGVLYGTKWAVSASPAIIYYSFPTLGTQYTGAGGGGYGSGENTVSFTPLTTAEKAVAREAFDYWARAANVILVETDEAVNPATIRIARSGLDPTGAYTYFPSASPEGGDTWIGTSSTFNNPVKGNYVYFTYIHEIGHALGLKHPHQASGSFGTMPVDKNSGEYTVMSYRSYIGASDGPVTNETWGYMTSTMMYDIAGVQALYGVNTSRQGEDTTHSWSPTTGEYFIDGVGQGAPGGNRVYMTVWDGGGNDTYDFSNYPAGSIVGDLTLGGITITSSAQRANQGSGNIAVGCVHNALDSNGTIENKIDP